ncbi:hypothetical protein [Spirosoma validum]|uniref:Acyloxyacyl hydrolase n=1 Tax=Spirosoma validum TaxID=2771355 RepID=A0A927GEC1_9BACT|nr:hypothetical protein [Spirosoma validum]MBD2754614.1 hypothetical protein [Spirosoma validum]
MRFVIHYFLLFCLPLSLSGQSVDTVYTVKYLKKSTSFAWTTFGGDILTLGGGKTDYQTPEGAIRNASLSPTAIPRLTIGGIHFWGHADFYVSFPLPFRWSPRPDAFSAMRYAHGIETGAKVYPFRLEPGRISPYVGISFRTMSYGHQTAGTSYTNGFPEVERMAVPLQAGLTYTTSNYLITAGIHYHPNTELSYAISPTTFGTTSLSPVSVSVGLLRYIDTDRNMTSSSSVTQLNRKHELLKRHNRLSAWYAGIGPSAAMPRPLGRSSYIQQKHPYLRGEAIGGFTPDLTIGRYFYKADLNVGLSYRTMGTHVSAFDADIRLRRHSFMVEAYKYLFNYLGFAPYVGPTVSLERLSMNDNERSYLQTKPAIGLIFGWDIRVTSTETSLLRTNLRWIHNLHLAVGDEQVLFDNIEFNFIQYVHYFGRNQVYQKYRKR